MSTLARFVQDQSGVTAIEYALLGTLVAAAIILGATALGSQLNTTYTSVSEKIPSI